MNEIDSVSVDFPENLELLVVIADEKQSDHLR